MRLDDFLEQMAARPFIDGTFDCALTLADWAMAATGCPDPAAHLRGRYSTSLGRERLLRRLGGLEAVIADCAARAGLVGTDTPRRGDIGLVRAGGLALSGICVAPPVSSRICSTGGAADWVIKSNDGLTGLRPSAVIRAWRVPHG